MGRVQGNPHPDQQYVDGLANNNRQIISSIYEQFLPMIVAYVKQNRGNRQDAEDLFAETLEILNLQARDGLQIRQSFAAYCKLICQRRWINKLKRNQRISLELEEQAEPVEDAEVVAKMEAYERKLLYRRHFSYLAERCRQILGLQWAGNNLKEVAEALQLNHSYVRRQAQKCKNTLMTNIQGDPLFSELI
ncbi:MAG: sigma-70 family RNA polymerase sigma factor [Bacteroidota bacterium]